MPFSNSEADFHRELRSMGFFTKKLTFLKTQRDLYVYIQIHGHTLTKAVQGFVTAESVVSLAKLVFCAAQ